MCVCVYLSKSFRNKLSSRAKVIPILLPPLAPTPFGTSLKDADSSVYVTLRCKSSLYVGQVATDGGKFWMMLLLGDKVPVLCFGCLLE